LKSTNHQDEKSVKEKYTTERVLRNGVSVVFRPIECSDQGMFKDFFKSLSPASVHFRFFEIIKELPNETVERDCNIDFSQEMTIVALPKGEGKIVAVARLEIDSERKRGEFALTVADAWQGLGLGAELLNYLIEIACDYMLLEIHCFVSSDNARMIRLAQKAGLKLKSSEGDALEMSLMLYGFENTPIA
jgi:acetyltransferase